MPAVVTARQSPFRLMADRRNLGQRMGLVTWIGARPPAPHPQGLRLEAPFAGLFLWTSEIVCTSPCQPAVTAAIERNEAQTYGCARPRTTVPSPLAPDAGRGHWGGNYMSEAAQAPSDPQAYCVNRSADFYPYRGEPCKSGYQLGSGNCRKADGRMIAVPSEQCAAMTGTVELPFEGGRRPFDGTQAPKPMK